MAMQNPMDAIDSPMQDAGPPLPATVVYADQGQSAMEHQEEKPPQEHPPPINTDAEPSSVGEDGFKEAEPSGVEEDGDPAPDEAVGVAAGRARKVTQIKVPILRALYRFGEFLGTCICWEGTQFTSG